MTEPLDPFDVTALEKSVNDSAVRVSTIWVSFLVFGLYLAVAAANVTHRNLLLEEPIKLPTINAEMPLVAFFLLAPLLFVVFHVYVLLQVALLARTAATYNEAVAHSLRTDYDRALIRQRLANTLFAQILAGSPFEREGILGVLLRIMSWATLVILPVSVLLVFQFKFLPYHSASMTVLHRALVALSLSAIVLLWPVVLDGQRSISLKHAARHPPLILWIILSSLLSFGLLTFPGDLGMRFLRMARGDADNTKYCNQTFLETSLGSGWNNLVVRWEDVVVKTKLPALASGPYDGEPMKSFRGRDLSCSLLSDGDFRYSDFRGATLTGVNFQSAKLDGAWLEGADLTGANFREANLQHAHLDSAHLQGADLSAARFQHATLNGANLRGAFADNVPFQIAKSGPPLNQTTRVNFTEASLVAARLEGTTLAKADLSFARLDKANLNGAHLEDADLSNANMQGANLEGALLDRANAQRAVLSRARLVGANLTGVQFQGARLAEANLEHAVLDEVDLTDAELTAASFREASLRKAVLGKLQLQSIDFEKADLAGADLKYASLVAARLPGASLLGANLTGADLSQANLKGVSLEEAILEEAKFSDAEIWAAKFDRATLQSAILDRAQLQAASFLGTKLRGVSFVGARLQGALFEEAALDGVNFTGSQLHLATMSGASLWAAQGAQCHEAQVLRPHFKPIPELKEILRPRFEPIPGLQRADAGLSETDIADAEQNWRECAAKARPSNEHDEALTAFHVEFACRPGNHQTYVAQAVIFRLDREPYRSSQHMRNLAASLLDAKKCPGAKDLPDSTKCRLGELAGPEWKGAACKADTR